MTVKEYVKRQSPMLCSEWIEQIKKDGFEDSESIILGCAEANNKILLSNKGVNELLINSIKT